jgi:hypothetical protein
MADELTEQEIQQVDNEIAEANGGIGASFNILAGADASTAKERRLSRLEVHDSDMKPEPMAAIDHPWAAKSAADVQTYDDWHSFLDFQDAAGRERHEDWDEILTTYIQPRLPEISKEELQRLLLEDGFGERCYQVGKKLQRQFRSGAPSMAEVDAMSPEQFTERLAEWTKSARVRGDRDHEAEAFVTRSEMRAMANLNPAEFGRYLDILKSR